VIPNEDPCGTACIPLPPLEEKCHCKSGCCDCGPYGDNSCGPSCDEQVVQNGNYFAYCRPVCYRLPEEDECFFCKYKKPTYYNPCKC